MRDIDTLRLKDVFRDIEVEIIGPGDVFPESKASMFWEWTWNCIKLWTLSKCSFKDFLLEKTWNENPPKLFLELSAMTSCISVEGSDSEVFTDAPEVDETTKLPNQNEDSRIESVQWESAGTERSHQKGRCWETWLTFERRCRNVGVEWKYHSDEVSFR